RWATPERSVQRSAASRLPAPTRPSTPAFQKFRVPVSYAGISPRLVCPNSMTLDLLLVLALLALCIVLFLRNKPRMDVVAVLAMVGLPLTGVLTVPEALAGFSDPSVVLIAALFVIGE